MAAQLRPARGKIAAFLAVRRRFQIRHFFQLGITDGQREAVAERAHGVGAHLFQLMVDVLPLARLAHAEALDGLGQDHGGTARRAHGLGIRGVHFLRVVAAARELPDVVVRHVRHQRQQFRILAKEMLAHVGAILRFEGLVIAVHAFHHALAQQAARIARQQGIPAAAPDDLDHMPAGRAERTLQLLDDLAVAAHRAVEALQVAVDDKDQVIEALASAQGNGGQGFGLVHLAIAEEGPYLAALVFLQATVLEVAHETGLVGGRQRAQAHGDGGKLPEVGHQPGMRIRGQSLAPRFAAVIVQLRFRDAAFQIGAAIDAGRGMALDVDQVPGELVRAATEEVVETHVVQHGRRLVGGDVAAHVRVSGRAQDHHHRIPADIRVQAALDGQVARICTLALGGDAVGIGGGHAAMHAAVLRGIGIDELVKQIMGARTPFHRDDGLHCLQPFFGFLRVDIGHSKGCGHGGLLGWEFNTRIIAYAIIAFAIVTAAIV
ncbi:hypothetical protein D3C81_1136490 [compost metagenome]